MKKVLFTLLTFILVFKLFAGFESPVSFNLTSVVPEINKELGGNTWKDGYKQWSVKELLIAIFTKEKINHKLVQEFLSSVILIELKSDELINLLAYLLEHPYANKEFYEDLFAELRFNGKKINGLTEVLIQSIRDHSQDRELMDGVLRTVSDKYRELDNNRIFNELNTYKVKLSERAVYNFASVLLEMAKRKNSIEAHVLFLLHQEELTTKALELLSEAISWLSKPDERLNKIIQAIIIHRSYSYKAAKVLARKIVNLNRGLIDFESILDLMIEKAKDTEELLAASYAMRFRFYPIKNFESFYFKILSNTHLSKRALRLLADTLFFSREEFQKMDVLIAAFLSNKMIDEQAIDSIAHLLTMDKFNISVQKRVSFTIQILQTVKDLCWGTLWSPFAWAAYNEERELSKEQRIKILDAIVKNTSKEPVIVRQAKYYIDKLNKN